MIISHQIVRGVKFGEYRCDKEEDLAMLAAQQYYVEFGTDFREDKLRTNLASYIPDYCVSDGDKSLDKSVQGLRNLLELLLND